MSRALASQRQLSFGDVRMRGIASRPCILAATVGPPSRSILLSGLDAKQSAQGGTSDLSVA